MTRADKFEEIFGYRPATDQVICNEHDCGESDACDYCMCNPDNIGCDEYWWNAEYKEPTTKNNLGVDCISRADAIQAMQDKAKKITNEDTINGLCGAVAILFDMPSVTPQEPRKGHWIDDMRLGYHVSICSNCNWRGHGDTCLIYKPKYCPNCGARMVEPQESEVEDERSNKSQDKTKA